MALVYATVADLTAYSLADLPDGVPYLEKILAIAERDVDRAAGYWGVSEGTGLKFDPILMDASKKGALMRATCAQAEYRLQMGEEFFIEAQPVSTSGDDTNFGGRLPRFGPKAYEELVEARLVRKTGKVAKNRNERSYPDNFLTPLSQTQSNSYRGEFD